MQKIDKLPTGSEESGAFVASGTPTLGLHEHRITYLYFKFTQIPVSRLHPLTHQTNFGRQGKSLLITDPKWSADLFFSAFSMEKFNGYMVYTIILKILRISISLKYCLVNQISQITLLDLSFSVTFNYISV